MSTPITPQTNAHTVSTPTGATPLAVEVKCQSFTKHIGAVFHNSLLVPINLGAKTLKFMGKNLPVFQWIKSLFSSPKSGPVRHSEKFQECLNELHKTTLSIAWDRANKEKTEARENWTNIRAKIIEALPISSTRPAHTNVKTGATVTLEELLKATNDDAPEQAETSNPDAQNRMSEEQTKTVVETLVEENITPPENEAIDIKVTDKTKDIPSGGEIEQKPEKHNLETMIEQNPPVSTSDTQSPINAKTNNIQDDVSPVKQAVKEISTEEIKQANQTPVVPNKTEFVTRVSASIEDSHGLPKEQTSKILEPLIEEILDHPDLQTTMTAKVLKAMVQEETHTALRLMFSEGLPWNKKTRDLIPDFILGEIKPKLSNLETNFHDDHIKQLISETLGEIQLRPYRFKRNNNKAVTGGYFKKTITTSFGNEKRLLPNTLVRSVNGNTYELLNTLTKQDVADIKKQGVARETGKTVLGQGGFGTVRFARNINDGSIVAVKKISSQYHGHDRKGKPIITLPEADQDLNIPLDIQERITTGRASGHTLEGFENSFALFEDHAIIGERPVWDKTKEGRVHLHRERNDKVYIFSELANMGDGEALMTRLHELRKDSRKNAQELFLNTAVDYSLAVKRLHSLGFHHRDIKPENFLHSKVEGIEQTKLADFGVTEDSNLKDVGGGTHLFAPPEWVEAKAIIDHDPKATNYVYSAEKHDAFSLGISLQRIRYNLNAKLFRQNCDHTEFNTQDELGPVLKTQAFPIRLREKTGRTQDLTVSLISEKQRSYQGIDVNNLQGFDLSNLDMSHLDNIIAKLLISNPEKRMSVGEAYEHFANLANIRRDFSTLQQ